MPVYEYKCLKCEKIHEVIQKFSDAPLTECEICKGPLTKLMSLSSFALKGSGWYSTDYKRAPQNSTPGEASKINQSTQSTQSGEGSSPEKATSKTALVKEAPMKEASVKVPAQKMTAQEKA